VTAVLADHPYPEQGYRSCVGILRLAKRYDAARLEAACAHVLPAGARSHCTSRRPFSAVTINRSGCGVVNDDEAVERDVERREAGDPLEEVGHIGA
jgi:hypothetical protein